MKSNLFKYSMLTVGIVTAMGITTVNAATPTGGTSGSFNVTNKATASYTVAGNTTSQTAESNVVTVNVSETGSFSLISTVVDNTPNDDFGRDRSINAQANSTVDFTHTLTNGGNVNDTYTVNITNASGDNFDYNIASSVIKYQKVNAAGINVGEVKDLNGGTIALAPGEKALITITARADTKRVADTNGILTVTAESTYLKSKPSNTTATTYTATNTDNALTKTPLYAITKSATTNLGNKNLDLNNANAYVDYTITVKNEGNIDGTAISISDDLPSGLVAIAAGQDNYIEPTVAASNGSVAGTAVISNSDKTITVAGQNIKVGETITVTFRAKKADGATSTSSSFVNYAVVRDNTKDDDTANTPDIIDRSDNGLTPGGPTESTYEDPAKPLVGADNNNNATVETTNQRRAIAITPGANKEVALVTPVTNNEVSNTYTYTITNNGNDITEAAGTGNNANAVKLSIKPTATKSPGIIDDPNISITRVYVDANDNGKFDTGETELTGVNGIYDLNAATPLVNGTRAGLAPKAFVKIGVQVASTGQGSNNPNSTTDNVNNIGNFETLTVAVQPNGAVNGTAAPTSTASNPLSTTSTTTLQGINLMKYQIGADCDANPSVAANAWSTDPVKAKADQCVFYKLEAKNTFTDINRVVNNLIVSDTLDSKLTYQANSFSASPTATSQTLGQLITVTFASIAANTTANVIFAAKPSQTGTNSTNP